ncbi:MAG: DUF3445 domain-containing protein [Rhodobacteraceae bacterium]|nr:DUF3445 domain-containing protein [Paracoccaceae bacterium]
MGAAEDVTVIPAPYLPFTDPHKGRPPGLFPLPAGDWTEADGAFAPQMALRDRLIAEYPGLVTLALPEASDALAETVSALSDHLSRCPGYILRGDSLVRPDGVCLRLAPSAGTLGRLTQEDWLILQHPADGGEAVLTAGALCFPAHWNLPDKLGKPLSRVHDPVPGYADTLAARVNRVFSALHPDRPLQRLNWSLASTPHLHCPRPQGRRTGEAPHYLRVERQTLRRLPRTGAIVFGVKTYLTPLSSLSPPARQALLDRIAGLSPNMADYKGGTDYLGAAGVDT